MRNRNIYINQKIIDGAAGGGNQFLRGLSADFHEQGRSNADLAHCGVIIVNSHHWYGSLLKISFWKLRNPSWIILHRVDGPVSVARGLRNNEYIDWEINYFIKYFVDAAIFQTQWSKKKCIALGMQIPFHTANILNGANHHFGVKDSAVKKERERIHIIATSWSNNEKKGFDIYRYLDDNLDFTKYHLTFVGNSPCIFKNIEVKEPVDLGDLAKLMQSNDIYLTASIDDPCSNSLIEGIVSGLVPVARNSGGHPEIVANQNLLFHGKEDILNVIDYATRMVLNREQYMPVVDTLDAAARRYLDFIDTINVSRAGRISLSLSFLFGYIMIRLAYPTFLVKRKIGVIKSRIMK